MKRLMLFFAFSPIAMAQTPPCGISTVSESLQAFYPPIARAAHVRGSVVLMATFDLDGTVMEARPMHGPEMLRNAAADYVKGWKANTYGGSRTCPVVISYFLDTSHSDGSERTDVQHVSVYGQAPCLCDPPVRLGRRIWYWPFRKR